MKKKLSFLSVFIILVAFLLSACSNQQEGLFSTAKLPEESARAHNYSSYTESLITSGETLFSYNAEDILMISIAEFSEAENIRYITDANKILNIVSRLNDFTYYRSVDTRGSYENSDLTRFIRLYFNCDTDANLYSELIVLRLESVFIDSIQYYPVSPDYVASWNMVFDFDKNDKKFDIDVPNPYKDTQTLFSINPDSITKIRFSITNSGDYTVTEPDSIKEIVSKLNDFHYLCRENWPGVTGGVHRITLYGENSEELDRLDIYNSGIAIQGYHYISPLEAYYDKIWKEYFDAIPELTPIPEDLQNSSSTD